MSCRALGPSIIFSFLLIAVGTLFLLDNLGVIQVWQLWRFWPVLLIVSGISKLLDRQGPGDWIWSGFLILCGGLWLSNNLHWIHVGFGTIWPLVLITLGVMTLTKALNTPGFGSSGSRDPGVNSIREYVVFSGSKRKLETVNFEGGQAVCVFGGVDLNLRKCSISNAERRAVIDVAVTFGGIEIKIPEGWRVVNQCVAVFGACEDKTLAPRPELGVDPPTLVITGQALFGAVNIEN